MSQTLLLLIFVPQLVVGVIPGSTKLLSKPSCEEFSQGVTFNETEALGTWYKVPLIPGDTSPHLECMHFSLLEDKERFDLIVRLGKHISKDGLNWEKVILKINAPCDEIQHNHTKIFYMEKVGEDGTYRALHLPAPIALPNEYDLYPIRMKFIGQYLALRDCKEHYTFLFAKQKPADIKLDESVKKLIGNNLPEDD